MGGTILNMIAIALGSAVGLLIGNRLPAKIQESVMTGIGLIVLFIGFSNAAKTGNVIIPLLSLVIGVIIGELLDIEAVLERFGGWLQRRFVGRTDSTIEQRDRFVNAFVTTSLIICVGPLAFVGSIMNGMGLAFGFQQLVVKSVIDGFGSMAFAASMGVGVAFSVVSVLIVQGGLSLLGAALVSSTNVAELGSNPIILEMTAVGGLMLIGTGLRLLDIKHPRVANFLPALIIAPLIVVVSKAMGINLYPF